VTWQVYPKRLNELMFDEDPVKAARVQEATRGMSKIERASSNWRIGAGRAELSVTDVGSDVLDSSSG
jgi:hypothetical protein